MANPWYEFVSVPIGGFFVVFIGSLLLFAEVLVKGRFILGAVGLASMSVYFMAHVQAGSALWMGITFLIGILMIVLDGKLIGDGTIGGIGLLLMLVSLAFPSPDFIYGVCVVAAFLIGAAGAFLFPKFLPRRKLWSKLMLKDTLSSESGFNSLNESHKALLGKEGEALTDFRPSGTLRVDGNSYSGVSDGKWIKKGSKLIIREVSGTRILVEPIDLED
jgi:membrane-bound ClpP family serine protease